MTVRPPTLGQRDTSAAPSFVIPAGPWAGPVPVPDLETEGYWAGLREREIRILRCRACATWVHPPLATCPGCASFDLHHEAVTGAGSLYSYTVVHREFATGIQPPYVAALVELREQTGLRLLTNIVNCREADLSIGLPVQPLFHAIDDHTTLLFFEPEFTESGDGTR